MDEEQDGVFSDPIEGQVTLGDDIEMAEESRWNAERPSQDQMVNRVAKGMVAFHGAVSPEAVYAGYSQAGAESTMRSQAAAEEDVKLSGIRQNLLNEFVAQKSTTGKELDANEVAYVNHLTREQLSNPDAIIEKLYGRNVVNAASLAFTNGKMDEAIDEDGDKAIDTLDATANHIAITELGMRALEDVTNRYKNVGTVDSLAYTFEQFIPFLSQYRMSNLIGQGDSYWLGENKEQQYRNLYMMPADLAQKEIRRVTEELYAKNPQDAINFLQGIIHFSASDKGLDNLRTIVDSTTPLPVIGFGPSIARIGVASAAGKASVAASQFANRSALNTVQSAMRAVAKAAVSPLPNPTAVLAQAGDPTGAAINELLKRNAQGTVSDFGNSAEALFANTHSINNPLAAVEGGSASLSTTKLKYLGDLIQQTTADFLETGILQPFNIARLIDPTTQKAALDYAEDVLSRKLNTPQAAIVDSQLVVNPADNSISMLAKLGQPKNVAPKSGVRSASVTARSARVQGAAPTRGSVRSANDNFIETPGSLTAEREFTARPGATVYIKDKEGMIPYKYLGDDESGRALIDAGLPNPMAVDKSYLISSLKAPKSTSKVTATFKAVLPTKKRVKPANVNIQTTMGTKTGDAFGDYDSAKYAADNIYGLLDYGIKQEGNGWYVFFNQAVDETAPSMREAMKQVTRFKDGQDKGFYALKLLRSPLYTLPEETTNAMGMTLISGAAVRKNMERIISKLPKMNGKESEKMADFMSWERQVMNKDGRYGTASNTMAELEHEWMTRYGEFPSEAQSAFYFALYRPLYDVELAANRITARAAQTRLGMEMISVPLENGSFSAQFTGKFIKELPAETKDSHHTIMIWDGKSGKPIYRSITKKSEVDAAVKDKQIIQLTNYSQDELRAIPGLGDKMPDGHINFLVVDKLKSGPLKWDLVPALQGVHVESPTTGFKVMSPRIKKGGDGNRYKTNYYSGDNTWFYAETESQAKKWHAATVKARDMLREIRKITNPQQAKAKKVLLNDFLSKNTPFTYRQFIGKFEGANKIADLEDPILWGGINDTAQTRMNLKQAYDNLIIASEDPTNILNGDVNLKFAQERDAPLQTWDRTGNAVNPVWKMTPARTISPIDSLLRVSQSIFRDVPMNNFKINASEAFIAEFGELLKADSLEAMRHNPVRAMLHPEWADNAAGNAKYAAARKFSLTMRQFIGTKTQLQSTFDTMRQRLADTIADKYGMKAFHAFDRYVDPLYRKDPLSRAREFAFHTKLGMFNPAQLIKQSMQFTSLAAIEGLDNTKAAMQMGYHMKAFLHDPGTLPNFTKHAGEWGLKPKHLEEMSEAYKGLKYGEVGRETSVRDAIDEAGHVQTAFGDFLHAGTWFFRKGEEFVRQPAWTAAYRKWRLANPAAEFDSVAAQAVLARANLLGGDMMGHANAAWQKGAFAPMTQFMGYQARLMEQMMGQRLTMGEKARLFGAHSAMFGLPAGAATTYLGIWPIQDTIREEMKEMNIPDGIGIDLLQNGFLQTLTGVVGGEQDVAALYGSNGFSMLKDFYEGQKDVWEIVSGASGSSVLNAVSLSEPFFASILAAGTGNMEALKMAPSDFLDWAQTLSSVNNARKMYHAVMLQEALTKNGMKITDVTAMNGVFNLLLGTNSVKVQDMYDQISIDASRKEDVQKDLKRGAANLQKAMRTQDEASRQVFMKRALLDINTTRATPQERMRALKEGMSGALDKALAINFQAAKRNAENMKSFIDKGQQ